MNIEEQLSQLAITSGINYSLEHIHDALKILGNPEQGLKYIHVAGTNGKGTTADFIAHSLEKHGKTVGLYSSPHLISYTERFQINGQPITIEKIEHYLSLIKNQVSHIPLTEFEILTLIAFLFFKDNSPDFVILETGLGGRLDATNVVNPVLTVITTISFDHQSLLGNNLVTIAKEKAGIMKKNIPLVTIIHEPEIDAVFQEKAKQLNCALFFTKPTNADYLMNNKLLANKALEILGFNPVPIKQTRLKGRMQLLSRTPLILAEVAHNKEGISNLVKYLKLHNLKTNILFSSSKRPEDDIQYMAEALSQVAESLFITEFDFYKAVPLKQLQRLTSHLHNVKTIAKDDYLLFIRSTKDNLVITGSIYFLGTILNVEANRKFS